MRAQTKEWMNSAWDLGPMANVDLSVWRRFGSWFDLTMIEVIEDDMWWFNLIKSTAHWGIRSTILSWHFGLCKFSFQQHLLVQRALSYVKMCQPIFCCCFFPSKMDETISDCRNEIQKEVTHVALECQPWIRTLHLSEIFIFGRLDSFHRFRVDHSFRKSIF